MMWLLHRKNHLLHLMFVCCHEYMVGCDYASFQPRWIYVAKFMSSPTLAEYDKCWPFLYTMLLRKKKATLKSCEDVAGVRRTQPPVDCLWCLEPSFPGFKRKSLIIFIFLTWYFFCIHLYVTICMKLDPDMHIGMHLVSFGESGVTKI
jgi:hypothetical protein